MLGHKSTSIAIGPGGEALGKKPQGEDQPKADHGNLVCKLKLGSSFHPKPVLPAAFNNSEYQSAEYKNQEKVHGKAEKTGNGKNFKGKNVFVVNEKFQEDGVIGRIDPQPTINPGFHIPDDNQKEPSESKTHVHETKQGISTKHFAVQEAFKEDLLYGQEEPEAVEPCFNLRLVGIIHLPVPMPVLLQDRVQKEDKAKKKRKDE